MHSIIHSGLIAGGKDTKEGRQTVFFTAEDPKSDSQKEEYQEVSKPRMVQYKTKWKVFHDAIWWINLRTAQDEGLEFWQTRSNAIIFYDPAPADCIEKVVNTKTKQILYQIALPPPKITLKDTWQVQRGDPLRMRKDGAED